MKSDWKKSKRKKKKTFDAGNEINFKKKMKKLDSGQSCSKKRGVRKEKRRSIHATEWWWGALPTKNKSASLSPPLSLKN